MVYLDWCCHETLCICETQGRPLLLEHLWPPASQAALEHADWPVYILNLLAVAFGNNLDLEEQSLGFRWLRNWTLGPDLPTLPLPAV